MRREDLALTLTASKPRQTTGFVPPLSSLHCPLCTNYFSNPVTLPCLHSYCRACLEKYNTLRILNDEAESSYIPKNSSNTRTGSFSSQSFEEKHEFKYSTRGEEINIEKLKNLPEILTVQCPCCVELLGIESLPEDNATIPFENARLARIVNLVSSGDDKHSILCQNCDKATSELKCVTCNAWLCVSCHETTHSFPMFKTHQIQKLTHEEMMALPTCETHEGNLLEFFSTQDEVGVCQVCLLKGDFVGKPYCLVSDVRKARQAEIMKGVEAAIELKQKLLQGKERVLNTSDKLDSNLVSVSNKVKENFNRIRAAIEKKEKDVLKQLQSLCKDKKSLLGEQSDQVDLIVKYLDDGIKNVNTILQHSNDVELVYLTVVLQEFVNDLNIADTNKFTFETKQLKQYFKENVDAELSVKLSDQVEKLVEAYAPVNADLKLAEKKRAARQARMKKFKTESPQQRNVQKEIQQLTPEQQALVKAVGTANPEDGEGCSIQ
eukprot:snap_masked-scaffold_6-processed-gene-16.34-mRNA-1 protein AED:1.00 eAED:1.00 QI:0/-1/0/0/-1/1/1/0/491